MLLVLPPKPEQTIPRAEERTRFLEVFDMYKQAKQELSAGKPMPDFPYAPQPFDPFRGKILLPIIRLDDIRYDVNAQ